MLLKIVIRCLLFSPCSIVKIYQYQADWFSRQNMLELMSISCTNVISTVLKKKVKMYQHPWGIIHGFEKIFIKHAES